MGAYGQAENFIGKGNVQAIQFSPDGEWLAIGTTALLELYETKTYQLVHQLETPVEVMDFRPDGVEIAVADKRVLRRFEVATGRELGTLEGHTDRISDLAYSPDGSQIASIDIHGGVRLWRENREIATFREAISGRFDFLLDFSPNGRQFIVVDFGRIEIWDIATAQLVSEWETESYVTTLALHPDGTQLAVGTEKGEIEFWSLQTGERTGVIDGRDAEIIGADLAADPSHAEAKVDSLAFSPDGTTLVIGFSDAVIAVWDTTSRMLSRYWVTKTRPDKEFKGWGQIGGTNYEVRGWSPLLALSPDRHTVVALADRYANVGRWEAETGRLLGRLEGYGYQNMLGPSPQIIGFSADGRRLATLGGPVRVWDTATTTIIAEMQYDNGNRATAFSPNGRYVAINHTDRRITVWDVDTATVKHVLPGAGWNWAVTFSPDSRLVAAVTYSFMVRVWEVETGKQIAELREEESGSYTSIQFSPDGKWLAAGGNGNWQSRIAIWETKAFTLQHVVKGIGPPFAFSPDSRWIAGYADNLQYKILLWNIETGKIDLELPTGLVHTYISFSPNGKWLATRIWGPDQEHYEPAVQIWDIQTNALITSLHPPDYSVIFLPDGKSVAMNHADGRLHLRPLEAILPRAIAVEPNGLRLSAWGQIKRNALLQNYPNPFNPETWIPYQLATPSPVKVHIYDLAGRRVRTLDLGRRQAGVYLERNHAAYWDGKDERGQRVPSGIYFYRLEADGFVAMRRMVILK